MHPSCARLGADEDGLLPEWVVYHELIATGHTFLSKVCAVEGAWVAALLPRLTGGTWRASGGASTAAATAAAVGGVARASGGASAKTWPGAPSRRNSDADVSDARARFLARKSQRGADWGTCHEVALPGGSSRWHHGAAPSAASCDWGRSNPHGRARRSSACLTPDVLAHTHLHCLT